MVLYSVRLYSGCFLCRPTFVDLLAFSRRSIFALGDSLAEECHELAHPKLWLARYPHLLEGLLYVDLSQKLKVLASFADTNSCAGFSAFLKIPM